MYDNDSFHKGSIKSHDILLLNEDDFKDPANILYRDAVVDSVRILAKHESIQTDLRRDQDRFIRTVVHLK